MNRSQTIDTPKRQSERNFSSRAETGHRPSHMSSPPHPRRSAAAARSSLQRRQSLPRSGIRRREAWWSDQPLPQRVPGKTYGHRNHVVRCHDSLVEERIFSSCPLWPRSHRQCTRQYVCGAYRSSPRHSWPPYSRADRSSNHMGKTGPKMAAPRLQRVAAALKQVALHSGKDLRSWHTPILQKAIAWICASSGPPILLNPFGAGLLRRASRSTSRDLAGELWVFG
jgi:hypothetical protein